MAYTAKIVNKLTAQTWLRRKIRRLTRPLLRERDVEILSGVAAGMRFYAFAHDHGYDLGTSELPVQRELAKHLNAGAIFYDIGAHVGFFTLIGAKLVSPRGHVYAFEPVAGNVTRIERLVELNALGNVTIIPKAVAEASQEGDLILASHPAGAVLACAGAPPDATFSIKVQLVAIDDLVSSGRLKPPAVVKIDVEGAELQVLHGMAVTIEKFHPVIIFEIDDRDRQRLEEKKRRCTAFLSARAYRIQTLEESYSGAKWLVSHAVALPSL